MSHSDPVSQSRREFLEFMGISGLTVASFGAGPIAALAQTAAAKSTPGIVPLAPSTADQLGLAKGFEHTVIGKFGDVINASGEAFGSDPDFVAFLPLSASEALLWVNHEYPDPVLVSDYVPGTPRTKAQVEKESPSPSSWRQRSLRVP